MGRPLAAHQLDEDTDEIRGDHSVGGDHRDLNGRAKLGKVTGDREQALAALADGIRACIHCRPDTELGAL
ncbi:DUF6233 domain-containing protein [Streptomyces sp. NBC_00353]|uniref:DUF6233 domain-containing protein n=1 Tax=Streptomyces sp. NBC_00353 TaxID=2975722 RepID=UPI002E262B0B